MYVLTVSATFVLFMDNWTVGNFFFSMSWPSCAIYPDSSYKFKGEENMNHLCISKKNPTFLLVI